MNKKYFREVKRRAEALNNTIIDLTEELDNSGFIIGILYPYGISNPEEAKEFCIENSLKSYVDVLRYSAQHVYKEHV